MHRRPSHQHCELPSSGCALPLWAEALSGIEYAALLASRVYRGAGVPRGRGQPVVLVPGFMESDSQMGTMQRWLDRIGYSPAASALGINAGPPDRQLSVLEATVETIFEAGGNRVLLAGHSLGGTLSRALAVLWPELVAGVVGFGAPVSELRTNAWLHLFGRLAGGLAPRTRPGDGLCKCRFASALARPFPESVPRVALYSRMDGIVDWRSCLDPDPGNNREVRSSHSGMVANASVYAAIAEALSEFTEMRTVVPMASRRLVTSQRHTSQRAA